jgi:hypothetical protein
MFPVFEGQPVMMYVRESVSWSPCAQVRQRLVGSIACFDSLPSRHRAGEAL